MNEMQKLKASASQGADLSPGCSSCTWALEEITKMKAHMKVLLRHLSNYRDEGPDDEGWQSEELMEDIKHGHQLADGDE